MSDSLSDFQNKLYSIKPFIETQSPPSSNKKETPDLDEIIDSKDVEFKMIDNLHHDSFRDLTPLRKVVSQTCDYHHAERIGESNFKTITSISSTIDMLFSKIEKIKQQFSYALEKPQSQSEIREEKCSNHFLSEKMIDYGCNNKENTYDIKADNPVSQHDRIDQNCNSKANAQSHSLPLQEHAQNLNKKQYFSHPVTIKEIAEPLNLFENFQPQLPSSSLKIRDFQLGKCIGSGKFGDVYLSMHKATGFMCAIKKIFKSTIIEYKMEEQFITELKIHYHLNHPNIIKLYGHFDDEYHIFLMMEYACDGTLMETLKSEESFVSRSIEQVLNAIGYMHRKRVVHRDIKPENIVLAFGTVKVCDFGWAAKLENHMKTSFCGTLDYVSPEMKDVGEYNESVDLWSIGVLAFQLLAGFPPFKHEISYWKLCGSQRKMKWSWQVIYPPELSFFSHKFIEHLLKQNPIERATIQECRCSYFIQKYSASETGLVEQQLSLLLI